MPEPFDVPTYDPDVIYERRISARLRGTLLLIAFVSISAGILAVTAAVSNHWRDDWLLVTLVLIVGVLGSAFSIYDIVRGGQWWCRLTRSELICVYPTPTDGRDFRLPVQRIAAFVKRIEYYKRSSENRFFIEDEQGERYMIDKRHFRKPHTFVAHLQEARSDIAYREESKDVML